MYSLILTTSEVATIRFIASRGYSEAVWHAITSELTTATEQLDGSTLFEIPESLAWGVKEEQENNGGHHFGPVSDELTSKLYQFIDKIV